MNSSLINQQEKRVVKPIRENSKAIIKSYESQNGSNLIPRNQQKVLSVILGNQQKFDIVIEKVIEALDKLDKSTIINKVLLEARN